MKAWVLQDIGNIALEDVPVPEPSEGEVLIRVKAAGICGSDIPRIYETGAHRMPLIPGHEFAGVVERIGNAVDGSWIGRRVGVFPKIPCGKCRYCREGRGELCADYDYVGSRRDGAFAEYVTAPARNLLPLPDEVGFEEAAMLEPMAVAANAVRTGTTRVNGELARDGAIAVCGMGTIGFMIVMLLKGAGFDNIYLIGNKAFHRKKALDMGIAARRFCDSRVQEPAGWLKEQTGGVDLYFECVGSNESIRYGLEATAPSGTVILVGNPRSDMAFSRDEYWNIPRKQLVLKGIWNSVFKDDAGTSGGLDDDWHYALRAMVDGRIEPSALITHSLCVDELERGFLLMRDKTEDYCKVMMVDAVNRT